ncbi:hypothetical protein [Dactylosporangium sp. NPDC049140]|uniref:hypothetical protein n=1 Tax=Dactylosporangium sp. NPDC049140 TaxID=3155647 RepID=UPI0033DB0C0B
MGEQSHEEPRGKRAAPAHRAPARKHDRKPAADPRVPALHRAAGNTAVADRSAAPPPAPLTFTSDTPQPKSYTVDLFIDGKVRSYPNLSAEQARERLLFYWRQCHHDLDLFRKLHNDHIVERREHRTAGFWSETFGGAVLPDLDMWNKIGSGTLSAAIQALSTDDDVLRREWEQNEAASDRGLSDDVRNLPLMRAALAFDPDRMRIEKSARLLERASVELQNSWNLIATYEDGVQRGAGRAITGIKVSIAVLSAAASGGGVAFAGRGAGLLAKSAASALTSGGLGVATETFTQIGELRIGARTEFDVGRIAKRGVTDTVTGFVSAVAGGAFGKALKGAVGRWLAKMSKAEMAALGLTEDELLGRAMATVLDWSAGVGATPLSTATAVALKRALDGQWQVHNFDEFATQVFDDMLSNAVMSAAMISTEHALSSAAPGKGGGAGGGSSSGGGSSGGGSSGGSSGGGSSGGGSSSVSPRTVEPNTALAGTRPESRTVPHDGRTQPESRTVRPGGSTPAESLTVQPHGSTALAPGPETLSPLPDSAPGPATAAPGDQRLQTSPELFLRHPDARAATLSRPATEELHGFTEERIVSRQGGDRNEGVNRKHLLKDPSGKRWLFKPASGEEMGLRGESLGIFSGERYRRAPAAALIAKRLGIDTPDVRLVTWNGERGSLQEWRAGYEPGREVRATDPAGFDEFWNSQDRLDLDAMDYVSAQQDRHSSNFLLKRRAGGGYDMLAIDQDSSLPPTAERVNANRRPNPDEHQPRPLPSTLSREMSARMRQLQRNWPEGELRQWLTVREVAGAKARLDEIVTRLQNGSIREAP